MKNLNDFLKILPWLALTGLLIWIFKFDKEELSNTEEVTSTTILKEIENIGRLELVKYNFKEITELKKISPEYLKFFKLGPDSKIALISVGEAVGCIDLQKISRNDIKVYADTVFMNMPEAELCYFKLDMSKTKIYSLETNPLIDEKEFIRKAYELAESEIKNAALNSGILSSAQINAELILRPLLESVSGKTVILTFRPSQLRLDEPL